MKPAVDKTLQYRIALREQAIARWLKDVPLRVLDLGAGEGKIWKKLRASCNVVEYLPVDRKPQMPACLQSEVTMGLLTGLRLGDYNLIDVETDAPWESWLVLAMFMAKPTVVCLTVTKAKTKAWVEPRVKAMMGGDVKNWPKVPANEKLAEFLSAQWLGRGLHYARVTESILMFDRSNVAGYAIFCPGRTL